MINIDTIKTVAYLDIENRKLLLTRSKGKKAFYMAGGKQDNGEEEKQALLRELKEELQIDIDPSSLKYYDTFQAQAYGEPTGREVKISCYFGKHSGELLPSSEIVELKYFTLDEYFNEKETAPAVRLIFKDLKEKGFID